MAPPEIGSPPADKVIVPADSNPAGEITGDLKPYSLRKRGRPTKTAAAEGGREAGKPAPANSPGPAPVAPSQRSDAKGQTAGKTKSTLSSKRKKALVDKDSREDLMAKDEDGDGDEEMEEAPAPTKRKAATRMRDAKKIRVPPSDSSSRAGGGEEPSKEMSKSPEGRDWSALPIDILQLFLQQLCLNDYVRFGAVCVSWNRAFEAKPVFPAPEIPWLMFPCNWPSTGFVCCQLLDNEADELKYLSEMFCPKAFIGSTADGFMIIYNQMLELIVVNPLTWLTFPFPSAATLPLSGGRLISKAALLCRPDTLPLLAVAYKYGHGTQVAFTSTFRRTWTVVGECDGIAEDMKFYGGLLYVITRTHGTVTWDLLGDPEHPQQRSMVAPTDTDAYDRRLRRRKFLVESTGGDLLQVRTILKGEYEVFKLDAATPKWCRLTSLCGDDSVLLSEAHCVCVSTRDFPVLGRNCIYSTVKFNKFSSLHKYCLSDGTLIYLPLPCERNLAASANWFTPSLASADWPELMCMSCLGQWARSDWPMAMGLLRRSCLRVGRF